MSQKEHRGWLANPKRKARRDRSLGFSDRDAENLIRKIDEIPRYVSVSLGKRLDRLMRLRDKALIATAWIWFKRAGEVLGIQRKDVSLTNREILVTFHIQKKQKRFKVCPECQTKNGYKSKFCRECKADLQSILVKLEGEPFIVTKRKILQHKFTRHIVRWLDEFDELTEDKEAWFFPALRVVFTSAYFNFKSKKPMTVQNFDRILKRLDPNMTPAQRRWSEDVR